MNTGKDSFTQAFNQQTPYTTKKLTPKAAACMGRTLLHQHPEKRQALLGAAHNPYAGKQACWGGPDGGYGCLLYYGKTAVKRGIQGLSASLAMRGNLVYSRPTYFIY